MKSSEPNNKSARIENTEAYVDVTIKANCDDPEVVEKILLEHGADYKGEDYQVDTYFDVEIGKLKLREGNIEHLLTHYLREESGQQKRTTVFVYEKNPDPELKQRVIGNKKVLGQVKKFRKIFFIGNVKFHLDRFASGQCFVEIEAIDKLGMQGVDKMKEQCDYYKSLLNIQDRDLVNSSYFDFKNFP